MAKHFNQTHLNPQQPQFQIIPISPCRAQTSFTTTSPPCFSLSVLPSITNPPSEIKPHQESQTPVNFTIINQPKQNQSITKLLPQKPARELLHTASSPTCKFRQPTSCYPVRRLVPQAATPFSSCRQSFPRRRCLNVLCLSTPSPIPRLPCRRCNRERKRRDHGQNRKIKRRKIKKRKESCEEEHGSRPQKKSGENKEEEGLDRNA